MDVRFIFGLIVVLAASNHQSASVSVKPTLCPTNKIAPHRRIANSGSQRTLGYFAELFNDNRLQNDAPSALQEQPQEDDPTDCGDIEDYDETDLSSITPQRKRAFTENAENRWFFNFGGPTRPPPNRPQRPEYIPNQPQYPPNTPQYPPNRPQGPYYPPNSDPNRPQRPEYPPNRPQRPEYPPNRPQRPEYPQNRPQRPEFPPNRPQRPDRPPHPPYGSGGIFGGNQHRPPPYQEQYPSENVKPVYEEGQEPAAVTSNYSPSVVGGSLGQIVGVSPARPTQAPDIRPTTYRPVRFDPGPNNNRERPERRANALHDKGKNPYLEALNAHPWSSSEGYIQVRPGAYMFYWLYYADGKVKDANKKPLVIWIDGGVAASGVANFLEVGPFDEEFRPRNRSWAIGRNILFLDQPVGSGFSYVKDMNVKLYPQSDKEAAVDLMRAIKEFYKKFTEFRKTPAYIFGQSYGGKLVPRLGCYLAKAVSNDHIEMNFQGIGIGSGWVDPKESTLAKPYFLYNIGWIDMKTFYTTLRLAGEAAMQMDRRHYDRANLLDFNLLYNIVSQGADLHFGAPIAKLNDLKHKMNTYVKPTLEKLMGEKIQWDYVGLEVLHSMNKSFMVPSTKFVELLLNHTKLKIAVYNGNLDAVTPIAGTTNWLNSLKWCGTQGFLQARRRRLASDERALGFYKAHHQLSFWWIFDAGHFWPPVENPEAIDIFLDYLTTDSI
ncbi:unnamed protein product [Plutella xylostella]|uniref:(diamondback moth) hypothetical protein n=1 Tax=Plutella xylostella TaxID=51655 RepID=A0A8S4EXY9_PLUXY|nr:unnamed protein product [Plutella xylostella]